MNIAIVGAGLSGLACALMLKQLGIRASVFDGGTSLAASVDWQQGAFIWPQGLEILESLLPADALRPLMLPQLTFHNRWGDCVHKKETEILSPEYGTQAGMYRRRNLLEQLALAVGEEQIHFGYEVEKNYCTEDKSILQFKDGSEQAFDLVIGADGVDSAVCRFISRHAPYATGIAVSSGLVNWKHRTFLQEQVDVYLHENGRLVTYPVSSNPKLRYWSVVYLHNDEPLWQGPELYHHLRGLPSPIMDMMLTTEAEYSHQQVFLSLGRSTPLFRERSVMLGEGAKAELSALGFNSTIELENGFALSRSLVGANQSELPWLLRRYQLQASHHSSWMGQVMEDVIDLYYQGNDYDMYPGPMSSKARAMAGRLA